MRYRFIAGMAILLLTSMAFACSSLRPKQQLNWQLTLEIVEPVSEREAVKKKTVRVIESRLDALAVSEFQVRVQETPSNIRIVVSLPNDVDRERLKRVLSEQGLLEVAHVVSPPNPAPVHTYETKQDAIASLGGQVPVNRRVLPYSERSGGAYVSGEAHQRWVVVESPAIIDGSELRNAAAVLAGAQPNDYNVTFSLGPTGAEKFSAWTGKNVNEYVAVMLNEEVRSVAFIRSQIADQGEISGRFTRQAAEDLALVLRSGALPKMKIVEEGPNQ